MHVAQAKNNNNKKNKTPNFGALQLSPPYRNFVLEISRKELGISRLHIRLQFPCSLLGLAISPQHLDQRNCPIPEDLVLPVKYLNRFLLIRQIFVQLQILIAQHMRRIRNILAEH